MTATMMVTRGDGAQIIIRLTTTYVKWTKNLRLVSGGPGDTKQKDSFEVIYILSMPDVMVKSPFL